MLIEKLAFHMPKNKTKPLSLTHTKVKWFKDLNIETEILNRMEEK